ncbi:MAG: glutathione S-transferase [Pseudomonadota bacterium]
MLKIYHAPTTRGMRVIWLCEELSIPYEVQRIDFSAAYRATPEWRALNPVGKVPVLQDGDLTMFESGAMVEYVLARYGAGRLHPPTDSPDYALCLQWMWYGEATLSRPLGEIVNHGREFPGEQRIDAVVAEMTQRGVDCAAAVGAAVGPEGYLLGADFSAADIMVGYGIFLVDMLIPEQMPDNVKPYWERLKGRPGFEVARSA